MHATELYGDFISWGYRTPTPLRAGSWRRALREKKAAIARAALYRNTPSFPPSRQVKRRAALLAAKH